MEYFNISTTWNESYEEIYNSFNYYEHNYYLYCTIGCFTGKDALILYVSTIVVICISLPLTLLAIYSLSSLVRKDHGAPLYVINLLISDLVQFLCMIIWVTKRMRNFKETLMIIYCYCLLSSVGFMVCISLERYLVIVWPLWYRFRRNIKTSVVVCVLVWILPPVFFLPFYYSLGFLKTQTIVGVYLPLPLFIFSLGGTLKALSGSIKKEGFILYVFILIIVCISLPLTLLAIYSLSSLVRKDHGAPLYVINLLISDLVQFLCMIVWVADKNNSEKLLFFYLYYCGLLSSVGFMVCISLERYLVIVWPLWYRFRRNIKISVVVCVLVWILPLFVSSRCIFWVDVLITQPVLGVYLLLPLPLFIFSLGGTLIALSGSISVSSDEKQRIVAVLVVVLLIYILLFMPTVILLLAGQIINHDLLLASDILRLFSPLADLILYIFMMKGTTDKILASLCCCRMQLQESPDEQHE
ncbi:LOW QUALITY PROTEIN: mas-related G-protein coupled receptor member X2-like [Mugil cephalus]|uniref:LOW QUALITY PROTEIN: mas-related G-protein coupled receptor member X2-like n=1 Tax=Mugil cephalus TaxID=48193 RepID=UPI001FB5891D|nr:LOW QUALITY PROTEIN: mas-related G-protein coupled receptor member X2-like [Mugil cephalus]